MKALFNKKALKIDRVIVVEGHDAKFGGGTLFSADAFYADGSVLHLGIFSGLETACREACSVAYAARCYNVRVSLPSEAKEGAA